MKAFLAGYLDDISRRDCGYGRLDCATLMADWVMLCGWSDPMADRRGTYTDERSYRSAIRTEGGMLASCRKRFEATGLKPADHVQQGDVALVLAQVSDRRGRVIRLPSGAIVTGEGMLALLNWPRGIVCVRMPVLAAWSVARG